MFKVGFRVNISTEKENNKFSLYDLLYLLLPTRAFYDEREIILPLDPITDGIASNYEAISD